MLRSRHLRIKGLLRFKTGSQMGGGVTVGMTLYASHKDILSHRRGQAKGPEGPRMGGLPVSFCLYFSFKAMDEKSILELFPERAS